MTHDLEDVFINGSGSAHVVVMIPYGWLKITDYCTQRANNWHYWSFHQQVCV